MREIESDAGQSKEEKETNKRLKKTKELGNRWGEKRWENHKGRVRWGRIRKG